MHTDHSEDARKRAIAAAGIAYDGDLQRGYTQGWDAALAYATRHTDLLIATLNSIGNGAGIAGDPATYPEYIMQMCRRAVEDYESTA